MKRRFILISNYLPDGQQSMIRYASSLKYGLARQGIPSEIWYPKVIFGKLAGTTLSGYGKWMGYVDKFLLTPLFLIFHSTFHWKNETVIHICDHSNAPYLKYLPKKRSGITCHDVLAIRGALGFEDAYCPASKTGVYFQKWILNNLKKAHRLTTVSQLTMNQLLDLVCKPRNAEWKIIHNSFNAEFYPMTTKKGHPLIVQAGVPTEIPFLLHVGSDQPRKNRGMLVEMVDKLKSWKGNIVYAGKPADEDLLRNITSLGLADRVCFVENPEHNTLVALYSQCFAFIFPSFSEGFGWPLIEAQACGAPVIASDVEPLPEVSNGTALHANPNRPEDFAELLERLVWDESFRQEVIQAGFSNCKRFDQEPITQKFIDLYAG